MNLESNFRKRVEIDSVAFINVQNHLNVNDRYLWKENPIGILADLKSYDEFAATETMSKSIAFSIYVSFDWESNATERVRTPQNNIRFFTQIF